MLNLIESIAIEREARNKRDREIVAAREAGLSYAAIGRIFLLSGANVKDRIDRFHRRRNISESADPFMKLSPKTSRLLKDHDLSTIEAVVDAYRRNQLLAIREFGYKRLREVERSFPVQEDTC